MKKVRRANTGSVPGVSSSPHRAPNPLYPNHIEILYPQETVYFNNAPFSQQVWNGTGTGTGGSRHFLFPGYVTSYDSYHDGYHDPEHANQKCIT